jgi:hypothetical protein
VVKEMKFKPHGGVRMEYKKTPETNKSLAERIAARGAKSFMEINKELIALQTKHDELAELVRDYFDAKINLDARSIEHRLKNCAKSFQAKLNATHGMVKAEAALRKAVELGDA